MFLSSQKHDPGCSSRIPIRILIFYPSQIPDPGVKKAPDLGSGSATLIKREAQHTVSGAGAAAVWAVRATLAAAGAGAAAAGAALLPLLLGSRLVLGGGAPLPLLVLATAAAAATAAADEILGQCFLAFYPYSWKSQGFFLSGKFKKKWVLNC